MMGLKQWCQNRTAGYKGVEIKNFTKSWTDGLAICAIIHSFRPDLIPYDTLSPANGLKNIQLALDVAEKV
jgi:hypothetical protein